LGRGVRKTGQRRTKARRRRKIFLTYEFSFLTVDLQFAFYSASDCHFEGTQGVILKLGARGCWELLGVQLFESV